MESKIEKFFKDASQLIDETKTLYEISETEMVFLTNFIIESTKAGLSPKLTAKLLKAAAHYIECSDELTKKLIKDYKNGHD